MLQFKMHWSPILSSGFQMLNFLGSVSTAAILQSVMVWAHSPLAARNIFAGRSAGRGLRLRTEPGPPRARPEPLSAWTEER
jgi:hypothetical protein